MNKSWLRLTHDRLVSGEFPPETPLLADPGGGGIIYPQSRTIIYSSPGRFKSYLMQQLGYFGSLGKPIIGYEFAHPLRTLYLLGEGTASMVAEREVAIMQPDPAAGYFEIILVQQARTFNSSAKWSELLEIGEDVHPDLLIIDPLYLFMDGPENESESTRLWFEQIDTVIDSLKCSVILVHHQTKAGMLADGSDGYASLRGHSNLLGWPDTILGIRKQTGPHYLLTWEKTRRSEAPVDRLMAFQDGILVKAEDDPADLLVEYLTLNGPSAVSTLDKAVVLQSGYSLRTIQKIRGRLISLGRLVEVTDPGDRRKHLVTLKED